MTVSLFENDDDDGNAPANFLSPLGLCLYNDIYALLSSSGLISSFSLFCMLLCSMVYVDTPCFFFFCFCFCGLLLPTRVSLFFLNPIWDINWYTIYASA